MLSLFNKECKLIFKSFIYLAFIGVILVFYQVNYGLNVVRNDVKGYKEYTENGDGAALYSQPHYLNNPLIEPPTGAESYGTKDASDPVYIMPAVITQLEEEYTSNSYITYPNGIIKTITLDEAEQKVVANALSEMKALNPETPTVYETFKDDCAEVDALLGGGSVCDPAMLRTVADEPVTYEEAMTNYNQITYEDGVSSAYARLFCDYMGIVAAGFAIFVAVAHFMRDRSSKMNESIYSRKISSFKLIGMRYLAVVSAVFLPFILLAIPDIVQLELFGMNNNISIDHLAYFQYLFAWILPTILFTTALGMFITVLTDTPLAIIVNFFYVILVGAGVDRIDGGGYQFEVAIRHNTIGNLQVMQDSMNQLIVNRFVYIAFSAILVLLTIMIYKLKREGKIDLGRKLGKIFSRHKRTSKAFIK